MEKPKIIVIVGSAMFADKIIEKEKELTRQGYLCLRCSPFNKAEHTTLSEEQLELIGEMIKVKIDMADSVMVVNVNDYIGKATIDAIRYARETGKPVEYAYKHHIHPDVDGRYPVVAVLGDSLTTDTVWGMSGIYQRLSNEGVLALMPAYLEPEGKPLDLPHEQEHRERVWEYQKQKINMADAVFVYDDGKAQSIYTARALEYAKSIGKEILSRIMPSTGSRSLHEAADNFRRTLHSMVKDDN